MASLLYLIRINHPTAFYNPHGKIQLLLVPKILILTSNFRETGDSTYNGVSSLVRSLLLPQEALLTVETASLAGNLSLAYHLEGLRHIDGLSLIEECRTRRRPNRFTWSVCWHARCV